MELAQRATLKSREPLTPDRWLPPIALLLSLFAVWEAVCRLLHVPPYLLPPPSAVLSVIQKNAATLLWDVAMTSFEAAAGLLCAFALATMLALAFTRFPLLERSMMPFLVAFQAVPIIAMAPLLVLWFGNGIAGKIVMSAIMCFFPAVINLARGLASVQSDALTLMHSLSATPNQILMKLRLPTSVPFLLAALRISATLSVIGALVAEISGATVGLGFRIVISTYRTDTAMLFAALAAAIALGLGFYGLIGLVDREVGRRWPFARLN